MRVFQRAMGGDQVSFGFGYGQGIATWAIAAVIVIAALVIALVYVLQNVRP